jgi:transcriptional regulator GlxA family with amidase domain
MDFMKKLNVGIYIFPDMTMMDGYGPLQILSFADELNTFTFSKTSDPIPSDCGAMLMPNYGFADVPPIDVLVVSGGGTTAAQMKDREVIDFLREVGLKAKYVTSVCTGTLILAETGLLDGYEVVTHWGYTAMLAAYPSVTQVDKRVAIDRNRITGGGITAGIDFALHLVGEIVGREQGQALELIFEYRPEPPFSTGSPKIAPAPMVAMVQEKINTIASELIEFVDNKSLK